MRELNNDVDAMSPQEVLDELAKVRDQLAKARKRRDRDAIIYSSTPDGAAETYRRLELTPRSNSVERAQLKATYLAGLAMAGQEHQERARRGNAGSNDGPLAVLPVGDLADPVVKPLVEHRIMGTFRNSTEAMETGRVTVTLLRLLPSQERKRVRLDVDADLGVLTASLAEVIATAWAEKAAQKRLRAFLDEDAAAAVQAAVLQGSAR